MKTSADAFSSADSIIELPSFRASFLPLSAMPPSALIIFAYAAFASLFRRCRYAAERRERASVFAERRLLIRAIISYATLSDAEAYARYFSRRKHAAIRYRLPARCLRSDSVFALIAISFRSDTDFDAVAFMLVTFH